MTDDHVKRFRLSEKQPHRDFKAIAREVRTKDNAQPDPPRPRFVASDLPGLAPPGSVGVRLQNDAKRFIDKKREEREAEPRFRPYADRRPDRDRWPSR